VSNLYVLIIDAQTSEKRAGTISCAASCVLSAFLVLRIPLPTLWFNDIILDYDWREGPPITFSACSTNQSRSAMSFLVWKKPRGECSSTFHGVASRKLGAPRHDIFKPRQSLLIPQQCSQTPLPSKSRSPFPRVCLTLISFQTSLSNPLTLRYASREVTSGMNRKAQSPCVLFACSLAMT
jgi:hypothetical protein